MMPDTSTGTCTVVIESRTRSSGLAGMYEAWKLTERFSDSKGTWGHLRSSRLQFIRESGRLLVKAFYIQQEDLVFLLDY